MQTRTLLTTLLLFAIASTFTTYVGAEGTHWEYSGTEGPDQWGTLDPAYKACSSGRNQSPVDLSGFVSANLNPIAFAYSVGGNEIINNGHTLQVNYPAGNTITVDGHSFELKQFHVHVPSENHVQGKSFPMEAHFVHADAAGHLAVVAVFFEEGPANTELAKAWSQMPSKAGEKQALRTAVSADALLPSTRAYYRYSGSLTTPPCSEGVTWLVLRTPISASKAQIDQVFRTLHHANNRPIQPLNGRTIEE